MAFLSKDARRQLRNNVALILAAFGLSLVIGEIFFRAFLPLDDPVPINRTISFHKLLPTWNAWEHHGAGYFRGTLPFSLQFTTGKLNGISTTATNISVNSYGFLYEESKSKRSNREEIRIALIGGSTIESLALQEEKRISSVLEHYLALKFPGRKMTVFNLGVSAQDSRQHVSTFAHHAVNLDLDFVVFLMGANDMYRVGEDPASGIGNPILTRDFLPPSWRKWLLTRSQLGRRLYRLREEITNRFETQTDTANEPYFAKAVRIRQGLPLLPYKPPFRQEMLEEYGRIILTMNGIASAHKIRALFLTQPALWRNENSLEEEGVMYMAVYHPKGRSYKLIPGMARAMLDQINERLLAECNARGLWCVDLASRISPTLDNFYDDFHYTEGGAQAVATAIGVAIEKALQRNGG